MSTLPNSTDVLNFWFNELEPKDWFVSNAEVDKMIKSRFEDLLHSASQSELFIWRNSAQGRLAEIIVLDQFSRNIHRDTPRSFAQDPLALALAQEAIAIGSEKELESTQCAFLYMPFMHSESAVIHEKAVELFSAPGMENNYEFEIKHKVIIDRFGRYPHRNAILGRDSTPEEVTFLTQPGSSF